MAALILLFLVIAIAGLIAALAIHVATLFGVIWPFEHTLEFMGFGVFIAFVPTAFAMTRLTSDFKRKDLWRAMLRGCPKWMRRAFYGLVWYAWVGFFVLPMLYGGGSSSANGDRSMSAGLLIFYAFPVVVFYSALRAPQIDQSRRCLNGHHISPLAKYCEECGAPFDERSTTMQSGIRRS